MNIWIVSILTMLCCFGLTLPVHAQGELISPEPHCAMIKNDTDFALYGAVRTAYGTDLMGKKKRHESSFRLEAGEQRIACATGPFYSGYKVELVIRTMIPVFSCQTRLAGTILIRSERNKEGQNRIYALCIL